MAAIDASTLLRPELLQGTAVLVAGAAGTGGSASAASGGGMSPEDARGCIAAALQEGCEALGARVARCEAHVADEAAMDSAVTDALARTGAIDVLVLDGPGLFVAGLVAGGCREDRGHGADPGDGVARSDSRAGSAHAALRNCLDASWNATRAVVNTAWLPARRGGRIVYVAPALDAGERAGAARAGLENLARTLAVEWARHAINVVTIAPGSGTSAGEIAALLAYLASPAGAYFSGCALDLGAV